MKTSPETGRELGPKKRVRDPLAKRQAVLGAALREFAKHGFAGARTDQIALVAGVSVGMIFKIFVDKRGLANAVYTDCLMKIHARIGPAIAADISPRAAFDEMWAAYSDFLFREPDVLNFFEYQPNSDFLDDQNRLGLSQLRGALALWVEKNQAAGVFKNGSSELLRAIAIGAIMRVLRESIDGNTTLTRASLQELNELIWESIVRRDRPRVSPRPSPQPRRPQQPRAPRGAHRAR